MRLTGIALAVASLTLLAVSVGFADEASQARKLRGAVLYGENCARCHGEEAMGGGPDAGELRAPALDLTRIAARRDGTFPKAHITAIIDGRQHLRAHGPGGMPVWGKVFLPDVSGGGPAEVVVRDKINMLVEYLEAIQVEPEADESEDES